MNPFATTYSYSFSAISSSDGIFPAIGGAFVILSVMAAIATGPYVYGFFAYRKRESEKMEKRKTIENLLVMKEVQNEIEEEMRRSLMNANLGA